MKRLILILLACWSSLPALAQCAITSRWGERGFPVDFSVTGNFAAAADQRGVSVYDISNDDLIRQTGVLRTNGRSLAIEATSRGEVVLTTNGLELIGISNGAPGRLFERPLEASTLSCEGAICAAAGTELYIFRVGQSAFEPLAFVPLSDRADAVFVRGSRIYVGTGGLSMSVYDTGGALIAELQAAAFDFTSDGGTLYAASGGSGLTVIEDGAAPTISSRHFVAEMDLRRVRAASNAVIGFDAAGGRIVRMEIANGVAAISRTIDDRPAALAVTGEHLLLSSPGLPVRLFDATSLTLEGEFEDRQGPLTGVATDGAYAYVADPPLFRVIDLRDRLNPREVASLPIDDGADRVRIRNGLAIVYGRANVHLIDVSRPEEPRYLGVYRSLGTSPNDADFAGDLLIEDNRASGFHVLDISNPANPIQIGGLKNDFNGQYFGVVALPTAAYGFATRGIKVIDLADPRIPTVVAFIPTSNLIAAEIAPATAAHPELLLVIDSDHIRVFDLSSPLQPRELAPLDIAGGVEIAAGRDVAYISTAQGDLVRIDLSTGSPRVTHTVETESPATQIALVPGDQELAIANGQALVWMRDLAAAEGAPVAPQLSATVRAGVAMLTWNALAGGVYEVASSADDAFGAASSLLIAGGSAAEALDGRRWFRVRAVNGCSVSEWSNVVSVDEAQSALVEFTTAGQRLFHRDGSALTARVAVANRSSSPASVTLVASNAGVTLPSPQQVPPSSSAVFAVTIDPAVAGSAVELSIAGGSSTHLIELTSVSPATTNRITGDMILLPGVAATPGARDTIWKSDLNLFCRGPQSCAMDIALNAFGTLAPVRAVSLSLRAGEGVVVRDAILTLFGVSPAFGALEIRSNQLDSILASASTYNESPSGRFGQRVSGVRVDSRDTAARRSRLHGVTHNATFRTNIGVVNASGSPQRAVLRLGDAIAIIDLRAWEGVQHPIDVFFAESSGVEGAAIAVESNPQVVAYQSRVDQRTGDGTFSLAQPIGISAEGSTFVRTMTVAVKTPGAMGTFWRTALQLANDGSGEEEMEVIFIPAVDPAQTVSRTISLAAGALFDVDDLFEWLDVPAEFTYGSLRIESASPFTGWSRIYNDAASGTYGQFVPLEEASPAAAVRLSKAVQLSSPSALQIFPVEESAERRTNFGVAEVAGRAALLTMTIFDATGALVGSYERFMNPFGSQVLFDILAPFRDGGPLRVQIESSGGGDLRTYASTVEASTGDAVYVPAE